MSIRTILSAAAAVLVLSAPALRAPAAAQTAPAAGAAKQTIDEALRARLPEDVRASNKLVSVT